LSNDLSLCANFASNIGDHFITLSELLGELFCGLTIGVVTDVLFFGLCKTTLSLVIQSPFTHTPGARRKAIHWVITKKPDRFVAIGT